MKKSIHKFNPNTYPLTPGIRLLEASAGTGKTFSLAHLVLRLITEGKCPINEILVVSFTKATATEIKAKITERIVMALKCLENNVDSYNQIEVDDVLKTWLRKSESDNKKRLLWASLLINALSRIDDSDITTIHGFCNRTLQREAIESGSSLDPPSITEEDNYRLIYEVAHEYWKEQVLTLSPNNLRGIQLAKISLDKVISSLLQIDNDPSLKFVIDEKNIDISIPLAIQFQRYQAINWRNFIFTKHLLEMRIK